MSAYEAAQIWKVLANEKDTMRKKYASSHRVTLFC